MWCKHFLFPVFAQLEQQFSEPLRQTPLGSGTTEDLCLISSITFPKILKFSCLFKSSSWKYEKALKPFFFSLKNKDIGTPYEASLSSSFCNTRFIYLKHMSQDPIQHLLFYSNIDNKKQPYFASWQINGQLSLRTFLKWFQHGISGNFNRWLHNRSTKHRSPSFQCLLSQQETGTCTSDSTQGSEEEEEELSLPPHFARPVYPVHKLDNLLGYSKNLNEVVVDRRLSLILFCCWMCLNAYLDKERGKKSSL